jgi:hypothetical protein
VPDDGDRAGLQVRADQGIGVRRVERQAQVPRPVLEVLHGVREPVVVAIVARVHDERHGEPGARQVRREIAVHVRRAAGAVRDGDQGHAVAVGRGIACADDLVGSEAHGLAARARRVEQRHRHTHAADGVVDVVHGAKADVGGHAGGYAPCAIGA